MGSERDFHRTVPGMTATGTKQIRHALLNESEAFKPTSHWVSDTPAYKVRITVNGDRGTLNFECHYVDIKTGKVVSHTAADQEVARIERKMADHQHGGRISPADPLSPCRKLRQRGNGGLPSSRSVGR